MSQQLIVHTGWRRLIGYLKLQVVFRKKATNFRALLKKMPHKDKASYGSSLPCMRTPTFRNTLRCTATHCNTLQHTAAHCNTLQHVATHSTHCNALHHVATLRNIFIYAQHVQCVAVCCSVLQCVAVCCGVLQCVAVC